MFYIFTNILLHFMYLYYILLYLCTCVLLCFTFSPIFYYISQYLYYVLLCLTSKILISQNVTIFYNNRIIFILFDIGFTKFDNNWYILITFDNVLQWLICFIDVTMFNNSFTIFSSVRTYSKLLIPGGCCLFSFFFIRINLMGLSGTPPYHLLWWPH